MDKIIFKNAEGDENRTRNLQRLADRHNEAGMLCMVSSGGTGTLTTEYTKISVGGLITIDETKDLFIYNDTLFQMEINSKGFFNIRVNGSVHFATNAELSLTLFKNGTQYSPFADVVLQGRGTNKPITASLIMSLPLERGDVLDIRAKLDVAGDVSFYGNNSTFEKKTF